jgi:hypothetical protein
LHLIERFIPCPPGLLADIRRASRLSTSPPWIPLASAETKLVQLPHHLYAKTMSCLSCNLSSVLKRKNVVNARLPLTWLLMFISRIFWAIPAAHTLLMNACCLSFAQRQLCRPIPADYSTTSIARVTKQVNNTLTQFPPSNFVGTSKKFTKIYTRMIHRLPYARGPRLDNNIGST